MTLALGARHGCTLEGAGRQHELSPPTNHATPRKDEQLEKRYGTYMGLTKQTLCGIVLFKLDTIFSMCFASKWDLLVLILRIPKYLGIKGNGVFSDKDFLFGARFCWIIT
jgi:hypothetical protein